ncbi:MAG: hypothetical protein KGJ66_13545, partial [Alphaproteobacteria bacterium]|nr:hypothetical protein [Alphaproteobacteria bacterium]
VFPCGSSGKVLASYDLHRLGIDFLTDAHTYGAEGAAACASLPLLNDVKDPTLRDEGFAPTSAPQPKPSASDAKPRHRSRRNHPQPKPLRGGITWFAEATPSGDRAVDIGPPPWLVKLFRRRKCCFSRGFGALRFAFATLWLGFAKLLKGIAFQRLSWAIGAVGGR